MGLVHQAFVAILYPVEETHHKDLVGRNWRRTKEDLVQNVKSGRDWDLLLGVGGFQVGGGHPLSTDDAVSAACQVALYPVVPLVDHSIAKSNVVNGRLIPRHQ